MINEQTYSPTTERCAPMLLRKCTAMMKSKTVTLSSIRNVINKTATSTEEKCSIVMEEINLTAM